MSVISDYILKLKNTIEKLPGVLSDKVIIDNRGDVVLFLKGEIVFTDQSELHFKEYFTAVPELEKLAYSYHYQDKEKEIIFRYDNAEHHQEVETFPHHKHVENKIISSQAMTIDNVLEIIIDQIKQ